MQIIQVLKRKDASSVVAAVVVGLIVLNAVQAWGLRPAGWLSGQDLPGGGWNAGFWRPLITLIIQLIIFEVLIRVYTWLTSTSGSGKK